MAENRIDGTNYMRSGRVSDSLYVMLEDAFGWRCPGCNLRNIAEWVPLELDSETVQELRDDGEPIGQNVYDVRMPLQVRCRRCRCTYAVANYLIEDGCEETEEAEDDEAD